MTGDMFPESIEDAIGFDIQAVGGYKKVAGMLWPQLKIESAYARLKNCLRDDKDEKLDPSELLLIKRWARDEGARHTLDFELRECHCGPSQPIQPETELTQLLRDHARNQRESAAQAKRIEALLKDLNADRGS